MYRRFPEWSPQRHMLTALPLTLSLALTLVLNLTLTLTLTLVLTLTLTLTLTLALTLTRHIKMAEGAQRLDVFDRCCPTAAQSWLSPHKYKQVDAP